jgi:hypothetical protein
MYPFRGQFTKFRLPVQLSDNLHMSLLFGDTTQELSVLVCGGCSVWVCVDEKGISNDDKQAVLENSTGPKGLRLQ